ncbi:MAG: 5-formyltetrahydrofolate cyclo-ligase [Rhodothalassiaceae bacterium]
MTQAHGQGGPATSAPDAKAALRRALRARRRRLADQVPTAGERAARFLGPLIAPRPGIIGAFWPLPGEIDCLALVELLPGRDWALPVVTDADAPLLFRAWQPGQLLEPGPHGTRQPGPHCAAVRPSILLVPLVGFDAAGARLGQGGGYYDRTIAALEPDLFAVGVAFSGQQVAQLPTEPHDRPLHAIVTEAGVHVPTKECP